MGKVLGTRQRINGYWIHSGLFRDTGNWGAMRGSLKGEVGIGMMTWHDQSSRIIAGQTGIQARWRGRRWKREDGRGSLLEARKPRRNATLEARIGFCRHLRRRRREGEECHDDASNSHGALHETTPGAYSPLPALFRLFPVAERWVTKKENYSYDVDTSEGPRENEAPEYACMLEHLLVYNAVTITITSATLQIYIRTAISWIQHNGSDAHGNCTSLLCIWPQ